MTAVDGPVNYGRGPAADFVSQLDAALQKLLSKAHRGHPDRTASSLAIGTPATGGSVITPGEKLRPR
jgi:hypothetical protein